MAEWRFLLFTMIVTVKAPICNVIRMSLTPLRVGWPTACRSCSAEYRIARNTTKSNAGFYP
nr:MAG TPA: hypothetical protein [Caudoviricetes sp.]